MDFISPAIFFVNSKTSLSQCILLLLIIVPNKPECAGPTLFFPGVGETKLTVGLKPDTDGKKVNDQERKKYSFDDTACKTVILVN